MAQQIIYQPLLTPVQVVGPQFVVPYSVDLSISTRAMTQSNGNLAATDFNGNVMFQVKNGRFIGLHDRLTLLDAHKVPILSFKNKILSAHRRWEVFRGDSSHWKDLLFTVKQTSMVQMKSSVEVFLATNKRESVCDFKVTGNWSESSGTVFAGESTTIIAQIQKKPASSNVAPGKETFSVKVFPNVDYAFIVALVMVLDEMNNTKADA